MGWKLSCILINTDQEFDNEDILKRTGFDNIQKSEDASFDEIMNPEDGEIYIGQYKGNIIICDVLLPLQSLSDDLSDFEQKLAKLFPNADIVSLGLHSVVNFWGYSVLRNGQKLRARAGDAEGGTQLEFGEALDVEKPLLAKSKINEDGERVFVLDDFPDEELTEDQVGEEFVFNFFAKYIEGGFGDDDLFELMLQGYTYTPEVL